MKLIIFLFLTYSSIYGQELNQKYYVINSETNKPIPYVAIQDIESKSGFYTNDKGLFQINKEKINNSFQISHVNYSTKKTKLSKLEDNFIYLNPKLNILDEVVLKAGKTRERTIGYIKKKKTLSWFISPKTEVVTLIRYSKNIKSAIIKKILIPIGKKKLVKKKGVLKYEKTDFNSVFRVNLYSCISNKPNKRLLNKPIIVKCNKESKDIIEIDISNQLIDYSNEGVFVGVEMIGELNIEGNLIEDVKPKDVLPAFMFTKKKKKKIFSMSYFRTISSNEEWINIQKNDKFKIVSEYNMGVSLLLSIYED